MAETITCECKSFRPHPDYPNDPDKEICVEGTYRGSLVLDGVSARVCFKPIESIIADPLPYPAAMMECDLTTDLTTDLPGGLTLANPTLLASGVLDSTPGILARMARSGAGGLITKSLSLKARPGYPGPTVVQTHPGTLLNAMGLPNPGIDEFLAEVDLARYPVVVIPNVVGFGPAEFAALVRRAHAAGARLVELNLSCPHHTPGRVNIVSQDPAAAAEVVKAAVTAVADGEGTSKTEAATATAGPGPAIMAKLTPNVTDIGAVAVACAGAGAEAISAINTLEALDIDPDLERPVLGNLYGGLSGPAIRPLALRKVARCRQALDEAGFDRVPVVAIGGIASGRDIARFLLVGAQAVQLGTAAMHDPQLFARAVQELGEWMGEQGYRRLADFRGRALEWLP